MSTRKGNIVWSIWDLTSNHTSDSQGNNHIKSHQRMIQITRQSLPKNSACLVYHYFSIQIFLVAASPGQTFSGKDSKVPPRCSDSAVFPRASCDSVTPLSMRESCLILRRHWRAGTFGGQFPWLRGSFYRKKRSKSQRNGQHYPMVLGTWMYLESHHSSQTRVLKLMQQSDAIFIAPKPLGCHWAQMQSIKNLFCDHFGREYQGNLEPFRPFGDSNSAPRDVSCMSWISSFAFSFSLSFLSWGKVVSQAQPWPC